MNTLLYKPALINLKAAILAWTGVLGSVAIGIGLYWSALTFYWLYMQPPSYEIFSFTAVDKNVKNGDVLKIDVFYEKHMSVQCAAINRLYIGGFVLDVPNAPPCGSGRVTSEPEHVILPIGLPTIPDDIALGTAEFCRELTHTVNPLRRDTVAYCVKFNVTPE